MAKAKKRKSSVLKTVLKVIGGFFAVVIVSIIGASIAIMIIVDKPFVESKMAAALSRQVSIGAVNVSVFSVLSGIEVKDVAISNYKTAKEIETLKGKPVPAGDTFVGPRFGYVGPSGPTARSPLARRAGTAAGLWTLSAQLTGTEFSI